MSFVDKIKDGIVSHKNKREERFNSLRNTDSMVGMSGHVGLAEHQVSTDAVDATALAVHSFRTLDGGRVTYLDGTDPQVTVEVPLSQQTLEILRSDTETARVLANSFNSKPKDMCYSCVNYHKTSIFCKTNRNILIAMCNKLCGDYSPIDAPKKPVHKEPVRVIRF